LLFAASSGSVPITPAPKHRHITGAWKGAMPEAFLAQPFE
jgi:hypothetical protein